MRRSTQTRPRSDEGETSPLVGLMLLGFITAVLASLGGVAMLGNVTGPGDASAGVATSFDSSEREVKVTYVADKNSDYVNVTVRVPRGALRARLDAPGASVTVDRDRVRVGGSGRIYDLEGDIIASLEDRARVGDLGGAGPVSGDVVEVTATAVTDEGARTVVYDHRGGF